MPAPRRHSPAASAGELNKLTRYDNAFFEVAKELGVKLAPRDDPDKSFAPCKAGTVFGVFYDTVAWTWAIPQVKMNRLIIGLRAVIDSGIATVTEFRSLVGKIINVRPLVPSGRFHVDHIMAVYASISQRKRGTVEVPANARQQMHFWMIILQTVSGAVSIPDPCAKLPASAFQVFTDAAGGTLSPIGKGTGGIAGSWWYYYPWSKAINSGCARVGTKKVSRKLSALELIGPLIVLTAGAKWCSNANVRIWVDNSGSVGIWKKGYSTRCPLCTTLVSAIGRVAAAIGCSVTIDKITRCSDTGAVLADELSKGRFTTFKAKLPLDWLIDPEPGWIPLAILDWIQDPKVDFDLGDKILREMLLKDGFL